MSKHKSKFLGFLFALFSGPISFLYVRKWKKALLLSAMLLIPFVNVVVYIYSIFAIISNVKQFNRDVHSHARFGIVVCRCQNYNRPGSKFCSSCGSKLVKPCGECSRLVEKSEKYCEHCGHSFGRVGKLKFPLRKWFHLQNN